MKNKFITNFDTFVNERYEKGNNAKNIFSGKYVTLSVMPNGLMVKLTKNGFDEISGMSDADIKTDNFYDLVEDITSDSAFEYHENLGNAGLGMTDAPGFAYDYPMGDDGEYVQNDESELYYFNDYAITPFMEELRDKGEVYFIKA